MLSDTCLLQETDLNKRRHRNQHHSKSSKSLTLPHVAERKKWKGFGRLLLLTELSSNCSSIGASGKWFQFGSIQESTNISAIPCSCWRWKTCTLEKLLQLALSISGSKTPPWAVQRDQFTPVSSTFSSSYTPPFICQYVIPSRFLGEIFSPAGCMPSYRFYIFQFSGAWSGSWPVLDNYGKRTPRFRKSIKLNQF